MVEQNSRLLPNSIRIIGMGHTCGGIMKELCESTDDWPRRLEQLRSLVSFFRNRSYRKHLARLLKTYTNTAPLRTFESSFIKWRYETIARVIRELLHLRTICEHHIKEVMFTDVQDKETLKKVLNACKDKGLWKWLGTAGKKSVLRCEGVRRWCMVCNCPAHIIKRRATKRPVKCDRSSRRLGELLDFINKEVKTARKDATDLTMEACEGDQAAANITRDMLAKYASLLELRTKYLALIPWRFATAGTREGAEACLQQLNRTPLDRLDSFRRRIALTLKADLQKVADGGAVSDALQYEIKMVNDSPLIEDPGEGYHRGTNVEHQRARVATTESIVQSVRLDSVVTRVNDVVEKFGRAGRNVVRYEWRHWKRILQVDRRKMHRNKRMSERAAFRRIYREDSLSLDNWDHLVRRTKETPLPFSDDVDAVQREYVQKQ